MGVPSDQFLRLLYGGPPQVSFYAYYMGGPLRSVYSLTMWGPPGQFLRLLYGAPLIFFHFLRVKLSLGGPYFFYFQGEGQVPPLAPPPCGRPCNHYLQIYLFYKRITVYIFLNFLHINN